MAVAALGLLGAGTASAEKRVALVVGNSAYKIGRLINPTNDADAVAAVLEKLGFDRVILRKDLDVQGFRLALAEMARASAGADVAAVFFAGHGIERDGRNYLIPIDAVLDRASDLDLQAIALATVLDQIGGATRLKLVILDACRNNVFPLSGVRRSVTRGLARVEPDDNTLVVYAARDGTTADDGAGAPHSPFTAALLDHIATPGLEITFVFRRVRDDVVRATGNRQVPYVYGTLGGDPIYLKAPTGGPEAAAEQARKAVQAERKRLEAERRKLEEERKTLALAQPAPTEKPTPGGSGLTPPSEPLPKDVPLNAEVLHLVETHPFFAYAPPVLVGTLVSESKDFNLGGNIVRSTSTYTWLRRGVIGIDESSTSSGSKGSVTPSTWRTTHVYAANGLILLGSRRVDRSRGTVTAGTDQVVRLDKLSGSIFPVAVGNRFSYEITTLHKQTISQRVTVQRSCEVTKRYEARRFHVDLTGDAYLLTCSERYISPKAPPIQSRSVYFERLGTWVEADPVSPPEQLIGDGITYLLKSFSLAR